MLLVDLSLFKHRVAGIGLDELQQIKVGLFLFKTPYQLFCDNAKMVLFATENILSAYIIGTHNLSIIFIVEYLFQSSWERERIQT